MTTDNASHPERQATAGERLRKAREAAGLTVAEVAERQHLRPAVIKAIESGDYRQIDGELFLKGYVRTYAGQVGLDPDSVIRQLDRELEPLRAEQKAQVEANPLVSIARRKRRKRQIARVVGILILIVAVFYGVSMYLARQQASETAAPAEQAQPPAGEQGRPALLEQSDQSADAEDDLTESITTDGDTADAAGPDLADQSDVQGDTTEEPRSTPDAPAGMDTGEAGSNEESLYAPVILTQPLEEPEPTAASVQEGLLQITFSGDCWVEVQDRNGRTIEASLRSAGDTLELNGPAPLRIVLGAVSAVESLSYGGERIDLAGRRAPNNRLVLSLP